MSWQCQKKENVEIRSRSKKSQELQRPAFLLQATLFGGSPLQMVIWDKEDNVAYSYKQSKQIGSLSLVERVVHHKQAVRLGISAVDLMCKHSKLPLLVRHEKQAKLAS